MRRALPVPTPFAGAKYAGAVPMPMAALGKSLLQAAAVILLVAYVVGVAVGFLLGGLAGPLVIAGFVVLAIALAILAPTLGTGGWIAFGGAAAVALGDLGSVVRGGSIVGSFLLGVGLLLAKGSAGRVPRIVTGAAWAVVGALGLLRLVANVRGSTVGDVENVASLVAVVALALWAFRA